MKKISADSWVKFINRLRAVDDEAINQIAKYVEGFDGGFQFDNEDHMKALIDCAYGVSSKYGEATAALACQMYDEVGLASGKFLEPAVPANTPTYGEVVGAVKGAAKHSQTAKSVSGAVGKLVKRVGADTTLKNALRDGAQFAWIPHGDTCSFCITLASKGWQNASKKALKNGHAEHIHANCDCTYAVRFDENTTVAGYDPQKYLDMYNSAEGKTAKEKARSFRRIRYQENKDKINAQKRAAYAERNSGFSENKNEVIINNTKDDGDNELVRITQIPASSIWEKVDSGEYSLRLTQNSYDKHIEGTNDYERYKNSRVAKGLSPQSVLTITKEEAQEIIYNQSGTGIIKPKRDGTATNIERITCDRIIGYYYDKGEKYVTNKAAIHHGSKGSHLVPIKGNDYD